MRRPRRIRPEEVSLPTVSVIMPTYGHAAFIPRALDSLCNQTFTDWELLIVDDGSPDDTAAVVQPFLADARMRYFRLETNAGLGAALNYGLERARGAWLAYLPSDDVYYAEHLAGLTALLESQPGTILAYSGARHYYNRSAPGLIDGYP